MYIERELETTLTTFMEDKEILAIIGPRQCGKTTLLNHLEQTEQKKGKKTHTITFENQKLKTLFEEDIDSFIEKEIKGNDIVFIDEIQYASESGQHLKYIYDTTNTKLVITGSSATELSIKSIQYLVGRILTFHLYPFTFHEFLKTKDQKLAHIYEKGTYKTTITKQLNGYLEEFITYGGYPRVVIEPDKDKKKILLENIYNTYLLKEIKEILNIPTERNLIKLLKTLAIQNGTTIAYNTLQEASELNYQEIKKYLSILQKTYICTLIQPYHRNKTTELVKTPKAYFFDTGFRNAILDDFATAGKNQGELYENYVCTELIKQGETPKYWRTKSKTEVDFILEKRQEPLPIEIKTTHAKTTLTKSFFSFITKYKPKKALFASLEFEGERKVDETTIRFIPITKLLHNIT